MSLALPSLASIPSMEYHSHLLSKCYQLIDRVLVGFQHIVITTNYVGTPATNVIGRRNHYRHCSIFCDPAVGRRPDAHYPVMCDFYIVGQ